MGMAELYREMPIEGLNVEYEFQPQSNVRASSLMSLEGVQDEDGAKYG